MRRATKDEIEQQKIFMELPKTGLTIVAFFATTSALILRLAPLPGDPAPEIFRYIFLFGILLTLYMFIRGYDFMATIVHNVTIQCEDSDREKQIDSLKASEYLAMRTSINVAVVVWVLILILFVIFI